MSAVVGCRFCEREFDTERGVSTHITMMHNDKVPWRDESTLRELYHDREMSLQQVADELGCCSATIKETMKLFGIPRRDRKSVAGNHQKRRPAYYRTLKKGYETWHTEIEGTQRTVYVHRLAAVAWFGFEAVKDKHVHHDFPIPWLNTDWNLQLMDGSEHSAHHAISRERDAQGRFK